MSVADISKSLADLSGTDRDRVLITAKPDAPHDELMAVLRLCKSNQLDATFMEIWDADHGRGNRKANKGDYEKVR